MPYFTDVMVDLETTGTRPDDHAIIQICAVRFNIHTMEIDHSFFNECLLMPPTRHWDEGTRNWWSKRLSTLHSIQARMRDPREVIPEFYRWVTEGQSNEIRFWAKPLSFDFPFVSSYMNEFGPAQCFNFRIARDLRTFMAGLTFPYDMFDESSVPFEGTEHDALFDTLHQIKVLFAAIKEAQCKSSTLVLTESAYSVIPTSDDAS